MPLLRHYSDVAGNGSHLNSGPRNNQIKQGTLLSLNPGTVNQETKALTVSLFFHRDHSLSLLLTHRPLVHRSLLCPENPITGSFFSARP